MSKREQFIEQESRSASRVTLGIAALTVVLLAVIATVVIARGRGASAATSAAGGDVAVPVASLADGQARFYRYTTASGAEVRFFVLRAADGVIRAAFDTCDVCFREKKGYRQQGDVMLCNNCGQSFRSVDINVLRGGCNPAPLDRAVRGDHVVLSAAALEAGAGYF